MKNDRGLTLIEVMISLVIVFIVFFGISAAGLLVLEENIRNSLRDEAVSVAEREVSFARSLPFTDNNLQAGSRTSPRSEAPYRIRGLNNMFYDRSWTVNELDPSTKQLTVTVTWWSRPNRVGRQYDYLFSTILRQ